MTSRVCLLHVDSFGFAIVRLKSRIILEARWQGVAYHPAVGEIAGGIPLRFQLRQTSSSAEGTILVEGAVPQSVSHIASGATDVADELAKNWTSHDFSIASLQVVRAVVIFRLPVVETQATVLHFFSFDHDDLR